MCGRSSASYPENGSSRLGQSRGHARRAATLCARIVANVDGFFASFVDDFDGALQGLPATPGDHAITLYLEGYRTVTRHVVVTSHATVKVRLEMDKLEPDQRSEPPPPPAGSRTGPSGHE
jgi:hypothetical protein